MEPAVPVPYCRSHFTPFSTHEAAEILQRISGSDKGVRCTPPVKPKGGDVFIYIAQSERHISKWLVSIFPGVPLPLVNTTPEFFCNGN